MQTAQRLTKSASDKVQSVKSATVGDRPRRAPGPCCPSCGERHGRLLDTRRTALVHRTIMFYRVRVYDFGACSPDEYVITGEAAIGFTRLRQAFQTSHPART